MVQIAAVVDVGTPLIKSCYTCESKQPMVFVVHSIVSKMHALYERGLEHFDFVELPKRCLEAAAIMEEHFKPLQDAVDVSKALLDTANAAETAANEALKQFDAQHDAASTTGAANRDRRSTSQQRRNYRTMSNPEQLMTTKCRNRLPIMKRLKS